MITFAIDQPNFAVPMSVPAYIASIERNGKLSAVSSKDFMTVIQTTNNIKNHYYLPISRQQKSKQTWIHQASDLFPEMRNLTKNESKMYENALSKLLTPTGRNIFDL